MWFKPIERGVDCKVRPNVAGCYSFEKPRTRGIGRSRHPNEQTAQNDLAVLRLRLGIEDGHAEELERQFQDFVTHHHSNIRWYDAAIFREEMWRRWYFLCNLAMLALIPVMTFGITLAAHKWGSGLLGGDGTVDALSAVLAGLFGVQRALTAWLDKRQLAALYNKTRAKLKTGVYTFEQTWRHKVNGPTLNDFKIAMESATDAARAVVASEQEQHYEIAAEPTFNLQDMLAGAVTGAKSLTTQLAAKEPPELAAKRAAEKIAREAEELIAQCQDLSIKYRTQLNQTSDTDRKQELLGLIRENNAKQRVAELDRAVAMAKIKAAA
jgi:hypothetical protein